MSLPAQSACVIRADGSLKLGMGHIMRSLALAEGLRKSNISPVFVTRTSQSTVLNILESAGHTVESFPQDWSLQKDLEFTRQLIHQLGARIVVTDIGNSTVMEHPEEYEGYLSEIKKLGVFLATIDDSNDLRFVSDVVMNSNCGAEAFPYRSSDGTQYLLGPRFFLFRDEFAEVADCPREVRKQANRIVVTLGGSDLGAITGKVLQALARLNTDPPIELTLVLGLEGHLRGTLAATLDTFGGRCRLFDTDCNMADLFLWSDVAITGGGLTKYETALTGTPSLFLSLVDNQHRVAEKFSQEGTSVYLGPGTQVSEEVIRRELELLLRDHDRRQAMSQAGKRLVDGNGVQRVLQVLKASYPSPQYSNR